MAVLSPLRMVPDTQDLEFYQGDTVRIPFAIRRKSGGAPFSLEGFTVRAQIRKTRLSTSVVASFFATITDAENGEFEISLSASQTSGIACGENLESAASRYRWDVEIVSSSGEVFTVREGVCAVCAEVTRSP